MKAALVLAPKWSLTTPPLALPLLAAHLRRRGHEVVLFDMNGEAATLSRPQNGTILHDSVWEDETLFRERLLPAQHAYFEKYADRILASGASLAGFSLFHSNTLVTFHLASRIKSKNPRIKIVLGGPSCLDFERCLSFLKADCVDAVVIGEGDKVLPAIADSLERTGKIAPMKGVLLPGRPETWKPEQDITEDLATLPFADYAGFALAPYGNTVKTIHSARGCVRKCNFCSEWGGRPFRQMPGRRIHEEIVHQLRCHPGVTEFMFGDSLINGVMKSLTEFCDLTIRDRLDIRWWGFAIVRPEMTEAVHARMRDAGCMSLLYGIESGSQKVLDAMDKHATVETASRVLRDSARAGVSTYTPMIVGYPSETEADFDASIEFVKRNGEHIDTLGLSLFSVFELKKYPEKFNLPPSPHDRFWRTKDGGNTFPMRISRARRMIQAARSAGIPRINFEGSEDPAHMPRQCDELLEQYADWEKSAGCAGAR
jgi:radical SAM superfamily enzyme YgiQ (UPF0313 family)